MNFIQAGTVSIIVPCYNEKDLIEAKIRNLEELNYSKNKKDILIVDGGSEDGTWELLSANKEIRICCIEHQGKNIQLNTGLRLAKGDFIVCTDVDGVMEKSCLNRIMREF
ncbi:unnamed protein product, partial [marine sediment metagenome]